MLAKKRLMAGFSLRVMLGICSCGAGFSLLLKRFAEGSVAVFMTAKSQQFVLSAARKELRACYRAGLHLLASTIGELV